MHSLTRILRLTLIGAALGGPGAVTAAIAAAPESGSERAPTLMSNADYKVAPSFSIGADISGVFHDPAQAGQGFLLEHIVVGGVPQVLVSWFTYLDGKARWLYGLGPINGKETRVAMSITSGADFPPRFIPSAANVQPWGELVLRFDNVGSGQANWTTTFVGFSNGGMPLQRLTTPAIADDSPAGRIAACHSGTWSDPTQSGHGIITEVFGPPQARQMLAVWYVYLGGEQRWITATGPIQGRDAVLTATITRGADFPPDFAAADVVRESWGTLTFSALDANRASWTWNSTQPGFGTGALNLSRITSLGGRECGPANDAEAARFLTQASFGPSDTSIADVRTGGYAAWVAAQRALAPSLQRPALEAQIAAQVLVDPRNGPFYRTYRVERWFNTAVNAMDQLRQRMAFALSQILVLSDVGALDNNPVGVAEYNDILLRNAFGNYRDLLREVTRSPAMGVFLTSLRNQKTDWTINSSGTLTPGLIAPDENYAREVMQLFSIGLIERNRDFSPILRNGISIPTYTQDLITQTAKVLTGLAFGCTGAAMVEGIPINRNCGTCVGTACNFSTTLFFANPPRYAVPGTATALIHPDAYRPMVCYPRYADTGRSATASNGYAVLPAPNNSKTLLAGITIQPSSVACHSGTLGTDQQTCIDYCDSQVDTLVTSLFMHPNVAPFIARQLIQRLTTSNPTPAYIDRVAAVFENDGSGVRGNLGALAAAIVLDPEARVNAPDVNFGKLREPLLKLTAFWRGMGAAPGNSGNYGVTVPERAFAQRPLGAISVFNFYEPDYQQPGEIADAGLFAPEFQILDESTTITTSDALWQLVFSGYSTPNPTTTNFTAPNNTAYIPPAVLDALPADNAALVEALNQKLMYGRMSGSTKGKLAALLNTDMAGADRRRKALDLIHLILISPEFAVQQ